MGRGVRIKPARLAEKLLRIRTALDLSQDEMVSKLGLDEVPGRHYISGYELGTREPTLTVLCRYCDPDIANIYLDVLARDEVDLPLEVPSRSKSEGIKRIYTKNKKEVKTQT